jgi:hypothetical protein
MATRNFIDSLGWQGRIWQASHQANLFRESGARARVSEKKDLDEGSEGGKAGIWGAFGLGHENWKLDGAAQCLRLGRLTMLSSLISDVRARARSVF